MDLSSSISLTEEEKLLFYVLDVSWAQFEQLQREDLQILSFGKFRLGTRERTLVYCLWARYKSCLNGMSKSKVTPGLWR